MTIQRELNLVGKLSGHSRALGATGKMTLYLRLLRPGNKASERKRLVAVTFSRVGLAMRLGTAFVNPKGSMKRLWNVVE